MHNPRDRRLIRLGTITAVLLAAACADQGPLDPERATPPDVGARADIPAAFNGYIRIGVVPSASSVVIASAGAYDVVDGSDDTVIASGSGDELEVTLGSNVVTRTSMRLQVACASPTGRDNLIGRAETLGYVTYTFEITTASGFKCWRVYLGDYPMGTSFSIRNAFRNQAIADGLAGSDSFWPSTGITVTEGVIRYDVARGGETFSSSGPVIVRPADGRIAIYSGDVAKPATPPIYRGIAEVALNSTGTLAGINELPFEEYLYGVVPRELPPTIWNQLEAQKAQAVAARTWALASYNKRAADGYNLRATSDDQVYGGFRAEHPLSTQAVEETAGIVAMYGGSLITAYFSSTSGGHTASFEEWLDGASPIPYLKGVPDSERGEAITRVPTLEVFKSHPNPTSLRAASEGDYGSDWSRYHRWFYEWSAEEISRVISQFAGRQIGRVLQINVLQRGPSGRVLVIEYVTDEGVFRSTRNGIRSSLKFTNSRGELENLRSTLFFIEPVTERSSGALVGFRAYGGGWGHGVGLSQTGAAGMAERGASFERILKHYYQGIDLVRRY